VIFIDFAKAFDKVAHDVLKTKLLSVGVCGGLHNWISDFLNNRSQRVRYRGAMSSCIKVLSGVVQGSVLGPLLFTLTINDLPAILKHSDMVLYADDGKIVGRAAGSRDCEMVQSDLDAIYEWSVVNKLPLSLSKCLCMHFGHRNSIHSYTIGGSSLVALGECKDLGLIRTSDFKYNRHIASMIIRASRLAGMIHRVFSTRNKAFITRLFTTYVRPILEYVSPVWNPIYVGLGNDIERVQRRFSKRLCSNLDLSYTERLNLLGLDELRVRRLRADLVMAFKALHGLLGTGACTLNLRLSATSTRSGSTDLVVNRVANNSILKTFNYRVVSLWNRQSPAAKSASSLNVFKKNLVFN
jgi:hypothetical protein